MRLVPVEALAKHNIAWFSKLADPQPTDVFAEIQARGVCGGMLGYRGISFADMGSVFLKHLCARCSEAASAKLKCTAISAERLTKRPAVSEMVSATRS